MTNANTAPIVAAQWRLRRFARGKPDDIRNQVIVLCDQLRNSARAPNCVCIRQVIAEGIERLKSYRQTAA